MNTRIAPIAAALALACTMVSVSAADYEPAKTDRLSPARALIAEGKWNAAIEELQRVNDAGSADWNNLMGYSHRKAKTPDYVAAERFYDEALRIEPKHRGALEYSGELFLMQGRLDRAEQRLAALDKACFLPCDEYNALKNAIAQYKAAGAKPTATH